MNIQWNAENYQQNFAFVFNYGESVLSLLDLPKGVAVLDLGCGNGHLTAQLRNKGYNVFGMDDSEDMLKTACQNYPDIEFLQGNAVDFKLKKPVEGIFSNAVFHWIDEHKQLQMLKNIAANLVKNGELVFEFGGYGCGRAVHTELARLFRQHGLKYVMPFYFPTIGQYAPLLEKAGFKIEYAVLFDRFTPVKGENGIVDWIKMFDKKPFENIAPALAEQIRQQAQDNLRDKLFKNDVWHVDYVRIRMKARKL